MSISALNWAWDQACPNATSKLVLIALADKANEDGECWPGMETVARMAGISARQVSTHLGKLETAGLLSRRRKRSKIGRLGSYVYHLNVSRRSTLPVASQRKSTSGSGPPVEVDRQWKPDVVTTGSPASSPPEAGFRSEPTVNPKGTTNGGKPRRAEIFETLLDVCGWDINALTKSGRGKTNRAAKELDEIGASLEGIRARAAVHLRIWPDMSLTPNSIAANYAELGKPKQQQATINHDVCPDCEQPADPSRHNDDTCEAIRTGQIRGY